MNKLRGVSNDFVRKFNGHIYDELPENIISMTRFECHGVVRYMSGITNDLPGKVFSNFVFEIKKMRDFNYAHMCGPITDSRNFMVSGRKVGYRLSSIFLDEDDVIWCVYRSLEEPCFDIPEALVVDIHHK